MVCGDILWFNDVFVGVPSKWLVDKGKPSINGWFGGTPISGNFHLDLTMYFAHELRHPNGMTYQNGHGLTPPRSPSARDFSSRAVSSLMVSLVKPYTYSILEPMTQGIEVPNKQSINNMSSILKLFINAHWQVDPCKSQVVVERWIMA